MAQITNSASATYNFGRDGRDNVTSNLAVANILEEYAITGTKTALNETFRPGENITYQVTVTNTGTSPLFAVTISDDLGTSTNRMMYLANSARLIRDGLVTDINPITATPLSFVLTSPLQSGETAILTYIARVPQEFGNNVQAITNTATILGREGSATGTEVRVTPSPTFTITLEEFANLSINKTVSTAEITQNVPFTYSLDIENSGNTTATGVVVTDVLPENFVISSITYTKGGVTQTLSSSDYSVDESTNTLIIPAGSTLSISVDPNEEVNISITGSISSTNS